MGKADRHWVDILGDEIAKYVNALAREGGTVLRGVTPIGTRKVSREEQFEAFIKMPPQMKEIMRQQMGEAAWADYEIAQAEFAFKKIGPAAVHLLPFMAPNVMLALEERLR